MAFRTDDLSVLAYANGFTLWHYKTADVVDAGVVSAYFDPAHDMLRAGDMILANFGDDGIMFLVKERNKGRVRVVVMSRA